MYSKRVKSEVRDQYRMRKKWSTGLLEEKVVYGTTPGGTVHVPVLESCRLQPGQQLHRQN